MQKENRLRGTVYLLIVSLYLSACGTEPAAPILHSAPAAEKQSEGTPVPPAEQPPAELVTAAAAAISYFEINLGSREWVQDIIGANSADAGGGYRIQLYYANPETSALAVLGLKCGQEADYRDSAGCEPSADTSVYLNSTPPVKIPLAAALQADATGADESHDLAHANSEYGQYIAPAVVGTIFAAGIIHRVFISGAAHEPDESPFRDPSAAADDYARTAAALGEIFQRSKTPSAPVGSQAGAGSNSNGGSRPRILVILSDILHSALKNARETRTASSAGSIGSSGTIGSGCRDRGCRALHAEYDANGANPDASARDAAVWNFVRVPLSLLKSAFAMLFYQAPDLVVDAARNPRQARLLLGGFAANMYGEHSPAVATLKAAMVGPWAISYEILDFSHAACALNLPIYFAVADRITFYTSLGVRGLFLHPDDLSLQERFAATMALVRLRRQARALRKNIVVPEIVVSPSGEIARTQKTIARTEFRRQNMQAAGDLGPLGPVVIKSPLWYLAYNALFPVKTLQPSEGVSRQRRRSVKLPRGEGSGDSIFTKDLTALFPDAETPTPPALLREVGTEEMLDTLALINDVLATLATSSAQAGTMSERRYLRVRALTGRVTRLVHDLEIMLLAENSILEEQNFLQSVDLRNAIDALFSDTLEQQEAIFQVMAAPEKNDNDADDADADADANTAAQLRPRGKMEDRIRRALQRNTRLTMDLSRGRPEALLALNALLSEQRAARVRQCEAEVLAPPATALN